MGWRKRPKMGAEIPRFALPRTKIKAEQKHRNARSADAESQKWANGKDWSKK